MGVVLLGQPQTWVVFIRAFLLASNDLKVNCLEQGCVIVPRIIQELMIV